MIAKAYYLLGDNHMQTVSKTQSQKPKAKRYDENESVRYEVTQHGKYG